MRPTLIALPPARRFTFVVGKGGTGKSTTAAALALAWADAGRDVHLLSTDPAPSIADIFQTTLTADASVQGCSPRLQLEEIAADRIAGAWLDSVRAPLEELVERGTYLDAADVGRLTHLTLPGADEVAAALRIAALSDSAAHVVVDTAPAGHTLRLLDTALLIDSWAAAFRAMADKAATVASRMTGARVRLEGEAVVDELCRVADRFRAALDGAAFVLVTRADDVVSAGTARVQDALVQRGHTIAGIIYVGAAPHRELPSGDVGPPVLTVQRLPVTTGCAALRAWPDALTVVHAGRATTQNESVTPARARGDPAHDVRAWLVATLPRMVWFAGKGGVGKSTCAAAVATALAHERPVLLCSTDPAGSLADVLQLPGQPGGGRVTEGLRALQVDAAAELAAWKEKYAGDAGSVMDALGVGGGVDMDRAVLQAVWDVVPPGVDELFAVAEILDAAAADETIIIDAAPTGHFLRLLASPATALEWTHALLRILLKYGAAGKLDGFSERVLAFARQLRQLSAMLTDPAASGVFVVSLPEPVVQAQTERLTAALDAANVHIIAQIVNRFDARAADRGARDAADRDARGTADRGARDAAAQSQGLRYHAPVITAPAAARAPAGVDGVAAFLDTWSLQHV